MSTQAPAFICTSTKTPLTRIDADGARCSNPSHWHRRLASGGFGGAELVVGPNSYRELTLEPKPLPTTADRTNGGEG